MIVHLVLFKPRPDLTPGDRDRFVRALSTALESIPSISRYRLGRRRRHNAAYEAVMTVDYEFAGMLEFEDEAALKAYLSHSAHDELGSLFYTCNAAVLAYDYELAEGDLASTLQHWI
jgi:Stress responsive A/B Barrel Domain